MGVQYANIKIVTDGLVLNLNAADSNSYVTGSTTWRDVSGNGRNFTIPTAPPFTTEFGGGIILDGTTNNYFTGPASNTFNLDQTHTIEVVIKKTDTQANGLFNWRDSSGNRMIHAHVPWSDNTVYYDVSGCCQSNHRISYNTNGNLNNVISYMAFRTRTSTTPYRQIFRNNVEQVNSGANSTGTFSFGTNAALIAAFESNSTWKGTLYSFRLYNRALSDAELAQNFDATRRRFLL